MERVPLDVPSGGRRGESNNIKDHDVVMSEIPWLCTVVDGSTLLYGSQILIPTQNSFLTLPRRRNNTQHPQPPLFVTSTMVENIKYDIGAQANWPPKHWSARGGSVLLVFCVFHSNSLTMAAAGVIGCRQLTNGGIQWLWSKALDVLHWLSKLPAIHLHFLLPSIRCRPLP
jgi:hypothetical protein